MPLLGVLYWSAFSGLWGIETQSQPASAKEEGVWPHNQSLGRAGMQQSPGGRGTRPWRQSGSSLPTLTYLVAQVGLLRCTAASQGGICLLAALNLTSLSFCSRVHGGVAALGKSPRKTDWPSSIQLHNLRVITGRHIGHDSQPSSAQESTDGQTGVCVCVCVCVCDRERGQ